MHLVQFSLLAIAQLGCISDGLLAQGAFVIPKIGKRHKTSTLNESFDNAYNDWLEQTPKAASKAISTTLTSFRSRLAKLQIEEDKRIKELQDQVQALMRELKVVNKLEHTKIESLKKNLKEVEKLIKKKSKKSKKASKKSEKTEDVGPYGFSSGSYKPSTIDDEFEEEIKRAEEESQDVRQPIEHLGSFLDPGSDASVESNDSRTAGSKKSSFSTFLGPSN